MEQFNNYINNSSLIGLIADGITVLLLIIFIIALTRQSTKSRAKIFAVLIILILFMGSSFLGATLAQSIYEPIVSLWPLVLIFLFNEEIVEVSRKFEFRHRKKNANVDLSHVVKSLVSSTETLSKNRVGALFVIEATQKLDTLIETAIFLDAFVSEELIETIFNTTTPLHDGAVVIRDGRIICAGVYFQPSNNENISKQLGSRHRAAIGASEMYDALIIVVSEETGKISVAKDGKLDRNLRKEELIKYLEEYL